jgi:hypothetical protein
MDVVYTRQELPNMNAKPFFDPFFLNHPKEMLGTDVLGD